MTPALWQQLEEMAGHNQVSYDMRNLMQKMKIDLCDQLCKEKYATCKGETGPGGSVLIYAITDAGREALAAHQAE